MHIAFRELPIAIHYIKMHGAFEELPTIHYIEIHSVLRELPTFHYIERYGALMILSTILEISTRLIHSLLNSL